MGNVFFVRTVDIIKSTWTPNLRMAFKKMYSFFKEMQREMWNSETTPLQESTKHYLQTHKHAPKHWSEYSLNFR